MLQLFRDNQIFTVIFVIVYFLIFSTNIWLYPNEQLILLEELPSTLSAWMLEWVKNPVSNKIAFSILLLVQAFVLNAIVNEFKLAKQYSYITAVCYILLNFSYVNIDYCSPTLVGNTFLLWSLYSMFASYEKRVSMGTIFNIGFGAAVAALLYHGFMVYLLWIIVGLLIVRSFDLQEFILLLMGFFTPFFLMGTYHFVGGNFDLWLAEELFEHYSNFVVHYNTDLGLYLIGIILILPFLLALGNLQNIYFKTTSKEKKYINVVLLMPVVAGLSFLAQDHLYSYHFGLFFIPISILLSITVQSYKSLALAEGIHFVFFMMCIGIQYQSFFFQ